MRCRALRKCVQSWCNGFVQLYSHLYSYRLHYSIIRVVCVWIKPVWSTPHRDADGDRLSSASRSLERVRGTNACMRWSLLVTASWVWVWLHNTALQYVVRALSTRGRLACAGRWSRGDRTATASRRPAPGAGEHGGGGEGKGKTVVGQPRHPGTLHPELVRPDVSVHGR